MIAEEKKQKSSILLNKKGAYQFLRTLYLGEENLHYGHYNILKEYTGIKRKLRIPGYMQHGWEEGSKYTKEIGENNITYFVWNEKNYQKATKGNKKNVVLIGAPFLYIEKEKKQNVTNNKLLTFPIHSWEKEKFKDELAIFEDYLNRLEKIRKKFSSITICLYWAQYDNKELVNYIKNRGYAVTTLGHRNNNKKFLYSFIELVSEHEFITSNVFSTPLFYSLYLNKKTFVYGHSYFKGENKYGTQSELEKAQRKMIKKYPMILWENYDGGKNPNIGNIELGYKFKKTPEEMKELFGWDGKIIPYVRQAAFWKDLIKKKIKERSRLK